MNVRQLILLKEIFHSGKTHAIYVDTDSIKIDGRDRTPCMYDFAKELLESGLDMETIRISKDDFDKVCVDVIHEIMCDKDNKPADLTVFESMVALKVTLMLSDKLFDK